MSNETPIPSRLSSPKSYHSASSPSVSLRARLDAMLVNAEIEKREREIERNQEKNERDEDRKEFRLFLASFLQQLGPSGKLVVPEKSPPASDDAALFSFARKDTKIERRSADLEKPEPLDMEVPTQLDEATVRYSQAAVSDGQNNLMLKQATSIVTDVEFLQEIYSENKAPEPKGYEKK